MKKTLLILSLACTIGTNAQVWQDVGYTGSVIGSSTDQNIVINNGLPYVSANDNTNSYKATVIKFDGTNWNLVGTPALGASGATLYPRLATHNGEVYVAFRDGANSHKATVKKFNGSTWINVGSAGFTNAEVNYNLCFTIDNGIPYISFSEGDSNAPNYRKATVMKYNGSSWVTVGNVGFTQGTINSPSLFVDNGTPYLAYSDGANSDKTTVMKFNGSSWVNVGTPGFALSQFGTSTEHSLIVDNGIPYLAYGNGYSTEVAYFNGSSWISTGFLTITSGQATMPCLISKNGTFYLAYSDGNNSDKASVMKYDGTNWNNVGNQGFSYGTISYTDLTIDNNILYMTYRDNGMTNVWKYDTQVGISESTIEKSINIYPNPSNNQLQILSSQPITKVEVTDITGKLSENIILNKNIIDISKLIKGTYFLKIHFKTETVIRKFIKN